MSPAELRLPSGDLTFLLTDIVGSTALWERFPRAMSTVSRRHDSLLTECIDAARGWVFKLVGDGAWAVFESPVDALQAAISICRRVGAEPWAEVGQLGVRVVLDSGVAEERAGDYLGNTVNRVARLAKVGAGGQILLGEGAWHGVADRLPEGTALRDHGEHRLKDLMRPIRIWQVEHRDLPGDFPPLRTLDPRLHNLPVQTTSFVGREQELVQARHLLRASPLLTLTGPGGCGKTRLALQLSAEVLDEFPGGLWLIELDPLSDPSLLSPTVASVLGIREGREADITRSVAERLEGKSTLLILDNCEHMIDGCAEFAAGLLRSCENIRLIATSREPLDVDGETCLRVPCLPLPELPDERSFLSQPVRSNPAVQLFAERASAKSASFVLEDADLPNVARICRELDGLPLAIELAAAWVQLLSVEEIAERLNDRFRLLVRGRRSAATRQRTLRALLDWSYALLTAEEKALLRRISVFPGSFSAAAAEHLAGFEPLSERTVLNQLLSLRQKSLVSDPGREEAGSSELRLLNSVRLYAAELAQESGELELCSQRLLRWCADQVEAAAALSSEAAGRRIRAEDESIRLALSLTTNPESPEADLQLRLIVDVWYYWYNRGRLRETANAVERCLARWPNSPGRLVLRARNAAGALAWSLGEFDHAREHLESTCAALRELGQSDSLAGCLNNLALLARDRQDSVAAVTHLREAIQIFRHSGPPAHLAMALANLGGLLHDTGDLADCAGSLEEARSLAERHGLSEVMALVWENLGLLWTREGAMVDAVHAFNRSLALYRQTEDPAGIVRLAEAVILLCPPPSCPEEAVALFAAARSWRARSANHISPREGGRLAEWQAEAGLAEERGVRPVDASPDRMAEWIEQILSGIVAEQDER